MSNRDTSQGIEFAFPTETEDEECEHDETDHFICLDCGKELDPGEAIDRAMDSQEDR